MTRHMSFLHVLPKIFWGERAKNSCDESFNTKIESNRPENRPIIGLKTRNSTRFARSNPGLGE